MIACVPGTNPFPSTYRWRTPVTTKTTKTTTTKYDKTGKVVEVTEVTVTESTDSSWFPNATWGGSVMPVSSAVTGQYDIASSAKMAQD